METYIAKFKGAGTICRITDEAGVTVAVFKRRAAALVLNRVLRIFGRLPNTSRITYLQLSGSKEKQLPTLLKQQLSGPFSRFLLYDGERPAGSLRQIPESMAFHLEVEWQQHFFTVTCDRDGVEFTVKQGQQPVAGFVVQPESLEPMYTIFCFEEGLLPAVLSMMAASQLILYG